MRHKRSARKSRQLRDRNRSLAACRSLRCEPLESRILLDSGGLFSSGGLPLPDPTAPLPPLQPGAISGSVWEDFDGNREQNGNEPGMGGVIVYSDFNFNGLLDPHEPHATTSFDDPYTDFDEGGRYTLENLQPGYHNVRQVRPNGFEQTFPSLPDGYLPPPWGDASVHVTFVEQGQAIGGVDFGNQHLEPGSVRGVKWEDANGNAERDADERGLPGVIIFSDRNLNGVLDPDEPQTVTSADHPDTDFDESGQYSLDNLDPGWHWIKEVVPEGYRQTFPNFDFFPLPGIADGVDDAIAPPLVGGQPHDVFLLPGESVDSINFGNQRVVPGSIGGVKWEDLDGDGVRSADEAGLAGVTIYADLNFNAEFDPHEPHAVTTADLLETDFDEGGRYTLEGLAAGHYVIREVVPNGFRQTFPIVDLPRPLPAETDLGRDGLTSDEFATVDPDRLDFNLVAGEVFLTEVAVTIHPSIFVPIEIDVMASFLGPAVIGDVTVINLSGPQLNGGTGDRSVFQLMVISDGNDFVGELQFVDLAGGSIIASIPLTINADSGSDGAHRVTLGAGETIAGLDFGNQRLDVFSASVSGMKWEDINANGQRDVNEIGLGGVTIYSDLNFNGVFDSNEPHAVTLYDVPETDFDEGGLYAIGDLAPGVHVIREVLPAGYVQIFPSPLLAIPNSDAHTVMLAPGAAVDGLDFGNLLTDDPQPLPGDFNADGVVDGRDLDTWAREYGQGGAQLPAGGIPTSDRMDGGSFLLWQRNYGRVSPLPVAVTSDVQIASAAAASAMAPITVAPITVTPSVATASVATPYAGIPSDHERAFPLPNLAGLSLGMRGGESAPLRSSYLEAVEAAFAENSGAESLDPRGHAAELRPRSAGQSDGWTTARESNLTSDSRGAVTRRADASGLFAAVDAAMASEFGGHYGVFF